MREKQEGASKQEEPKVVEKKKEPIKEEPEKKKEIWKIDKKRNDTKKQEYVNIASTHYEKDLSYNDSHNAETLKNQELKNKAELSSFTIGKHSRFDDKDKGEYIPPDKKYKPTKQQEDEARRKKEEYEKRMKQQAEERAKKALEHESKQFNKVYETKGQDKYEVRVSIEHLKKAFSKSGQTVMILELLGGLILILGIIGGIMWYSKKKKSVDEETAPLREEPQSKMDSVRSQNL